ncbi:E3 ubiquitin-protein ligase FANCL [Patella vulgata]|uniref:E3 ubiquitin-protein ligase FANCL n=1 Tax=Patella vulgata TaxID=6465 RepID=UPI0024A966FA|nr:E3 ubiquitin-protein ligase FANCL [Patella vulgata]XP_050406741.2 E3 ubiquitin-protein ligase FANCL [Patella vulgata]XP_050406742.2 E3 ubiquitin-protein ligase FANCL [Patella vulgata]
MAIDLSSFPCLVPQDETGRCYDGYLTIGQNEFRMKLTVPSSNLSETEIVCEWKLQEIIDEYMPIIRQRLVHCKDLNTFLKEVISIVESKIKYEESPDITCNLTSHIVTEIEKIGWHKLVAIDTSFHSVTLKALDSQQREHLLNIKLNSQCINAAPVTTTYLPCISLFHWNKEDGLVSLFNEFESTLKNYEEFWDEMEEIDTCTWVLEPEKPTYAAVHRRIAIGTNASVQITVDPKQPKVFPEFVFLGADQIINPLKENLNQNLYRWDISRHLLVNLETVLDIKFPSPTNSKKEDFSVECGICYCYRLEQFTPDIVCDDKRCGQPFHRICLYEWLRTLPSTRQSFNTIYGECPFCNKSITVKMPLS